MDMNAREAMHVIELRTAPQGHPAYRRVCQQMHRRDRRRRRPPRDRRGHVASSITPTVELERLQEERRLEQKRAKHGGATAS